LVSLTPVNTDQEQRLNPENAAFMLGLGKIGQVAWSTLVAEKKKAGGCFPEAVSPAAQGRVVAALGMSGAPSFWAGGVSARRRSGRAGLRRAGIRGRIQGEAHRGPF